MGFLKVFAQEQGFLDAYDLPGPVFAESLFICDACPRVFLDVRIPAYFTAQLGRFHTEFYFSKQGYRQSYHTDRKAAELWIAICRGQKKYRVVPRSVVWKTLGRAIDSQLDKLLLRSAESPLGLPIWEGVASAGDVVYIPPGAVHAVDTLADSVSIVNDFLEIGELSRGNRIINMLNPALQLSAYPKVMVLDGKGVVTDANSTAKGFPSLREMAGFLYSLSPSSFDSGEIWKAK